MGSFIFYLLYHCAGLISNVRFVVMPLLRMGKSLLIWIRGKGVGLCRCLNTSVKGLFVGGGVLPRILILGTIYRCGHIYAPALLSFRKEVPVDLKALEKNVTP